MGNLPGDHDGEIFIVDDDSAVRDALRLVFELEGFRVSVFSDGGSFLAVAKTRQPACVILDVHMPGRSGLEVLTELGATVPGRGLYVVDGRYQDPAAYDGWLAETRPLVRTLLETREGAVA